MFSQRVIKIVIIKKENDKIIIRFQDFPESNRFEYFYSICYCPVVIRLMTSEYIRVTHYCVILCGWSFHPVEPAKFSRSVVCSYTVVSVSHVWVMYESCVSHVWVICESCVSHVWVMCESCVSHEHVNDKQWTNVDMLIKQAIFNYGTHSPCRFQYLLCYISSFWNFCRQFHVACQFNNFRQTF